MVGRKNEELRMLITSLKRLSIESKAALWKRLAVDLEKPSRRRRVVNVSKLERVAESGDVVVVPGKVLGSGVLTKSLTVAAYSFSDDAVRKIRASKGKVLSISELMRSNPKGSGVKIVG